MAPSASHRGSAGFTLLEVLVAAVIAALALGVLFSGAAGGIRTARIAAHVQEATSRAQSRLAVLAHGAPPPLGTQSGEDGGGFAWRTAVTRVASQAGLALLDLGVTLSWQLDGGTRAVTLHTRRLVPLPRQSP